MRSDQNDYLEHQGIPGMKWGRRRYQYEDGSLTPEGRERYRKQKAANRAKKKQGFFRKKPTKASKAKSEPKTRDISEMSDDELRALINRAQLEQQYKQFISPERVKKGKNVVAEILGDAAKDVAKHYTRRAMATGVDAVLDKLGIELKGSVPKKKKKDDDD